MASQWVTNDSWCRLRKPRSLRSPRESELEETSPPPSPPRRWRSEGPEGRGGFHGVFFGAKNMGKLGKLMMNQWKLWEKLWENFIDKKTMNMGSDENIWRNNGKIVMNQLSIIYKWEMFQHLPKNGWRWVGLPGGKLTVSVENQQL